TSNLIMILSRDSLKKIAGIKSQHIPGKQVFELPERVLQFGTGVLLRALPDYFIDKANKENIFNGRIVIVKSTGQGEIESYGLQDSLYTLSIKGIEDGQLIDDTIINASVSRVLSAQHDWKTVLACAQNPDLQVVISNVTEAALVNVDDSPSDEPPGSFPGKLLSFLLERYRRLGGSPESGLVIIPTELIPDNGLLLKSILLDKCRKNNLDPDFVSWLQTANDFCSSLVDCIVPGALPKDGQEALHSRFGYADSLAIMSEVYRLWAIESQQEKTKTILSFAKADPRVIVTTDISRFRELKLRLLNGAHTFTCGLAIWAGFTTVKQAMNDKKFSNFITALLHQELTLAVESERISREEAIRFADSVLDRFRNPFLEHRWQSICLQYSTKMRSRNVANILNYYQKEKKAPRLMAAGFAGWLFYMKSEKKEEHQFDGNLRGIEYRLQDEEAGKLNVYWSKADGNLNWLIESVLGDTTLWSEDLRQINGFKELVLENLMLLMNGSPDAFFKLNT
ncbi:MAG TPA: tagaturonate reductase, partial [Puia sp.]|nr:tagaturonate reductase [Puia sp.]